ncbi:hypothetical protein [Priestia endophytica]|nr:hypothetical protein [Priestia endophytica]MCY8232527.1 hypothetical protein [Priestia endophytica]
MISNSLHLTHFPLAVFRVITLPVSTLLYATENTMDKLTILDGDRICA